MGIWDLAESLIPIRKSQIGTASLQELDGIGKRLVRRDIGQCSLIVTPASASDGLARSAHVCEEGRYEMGHEPDVLVTHVLIDVDQYQNPREKDPENNICPVRESVCRIEIWIEQDENDENQPREEKRE